MNLNFTDVIAVAKHATTRHGAVWRAMTFEDQATALEFASDVLHKAVELGIVTLPAPPSPTSGAETQPSKTPTPAK